MKKGLVLEGGAMRGLFTAGITDVLMENNIEFDGLIGVSAGAAFGCNYKSGQIGRSIRYNLKYCKDKRYSSFYSLIFTGNFYGADFCYHQIPDKLDVFDRKAFLENPMEFHIVCTDILTGKPIYRKCENMDYETLEWMRASASLPLLSRIVKINGYKLLDGGITDSVPLKYFESIGYEKNIVILTQPLGYQKKPSRFTKMIKLTHSKYPALIKAMENRHIMYNDTLEYIRQQELAGKTLVLRPEKSLPINRTENEPHLLQEVYDIGRQTAKENLEKIIEFLKD